MILKNKLADNLLLLALGFWLIFFSVNAMAAIGEVINLAGVLSSQKLSGEVRFLAEGSSVDEGDQLTTQAESFARIRWTDGGEMVLKPESVFQVNTYAFEQFEPTKDKFNYSLVKGSLRAITGLIGKRGDANAYQGKTGTAVIGIRGTDFEARWCSGDCVNLPDGLYTQVTDGRIVTSNALGQLVLGAGQFGYVGLNQSPVLLQTKPDVFVPLPKPVMMREMLFDRARSNFQTENTGRSCRVK